VIADGEGREAWELHQVRAHLWVAWEVEGRVGARASTASSDWRSSGSGGEVVPVGIGRGGGVGELREVTAELLVWSARAEEGCSGGSAAASSSSELRQSVALFWHFGAGSERKSERNRMLGFSKCWGVRELGSWGATASHPRRQRGGGQRWTAAAWQGEEGTVRGIEAVESFGAMRGRGTSSRRWPPGRSTVAAALNNGGGREAEQAGKLEEGENGLKCNFKNSRDPTVNQQ